MSQSQPSQQFPVSHDSLTSALAPLPGDDQPLEKREAALLRSLVTRAPDPFVSSTLQYAEAHGGRVGAVTIDVADVRTTMAWLASASQAAEQLELKLRRLQRDMLRRRAGLSKELLAGLASLEGEARGESGIELRDHASRLRELTRRPRVRKPKAAKPETPANGG